MTKNSSPNDRLMIQILRPTLPAKLVSARTFDANLVRSLSDWVSIREVPLLRWLDAVFDRAPTPSVLRQFSEQFREVTRGYDFLCPDHHAIPLAPSLIHLRNLARAPIRLLLIAHAPGAYALEWVLLRPLLRAGDRIVAPTHSTREIIHYLCPEISEYVQVVPHPMPPLPPAAAYSPAHLVSLSRIHPSKLLHRQVETMAVLRGRHVRTPPLRIAGPLDDPSHGGRSAYARSLAAKIRRLRLDDQVELVDEVKGDQARADFLACSRLLLNLSVSVEESFGKAAVEAMQMGVPVLASRWDGLPETVGDSQACVPVEDAELGMDVDPEGLADTIERLLADPPDAGDCRARAARFHPARVGPAYEALLVEALDATYAARGGASDHGDSNPAEGAALRGLLGQIAPLNCLSWEEIFTLHMADVPRLREAIVGTASTDVSQGETLRSLIFLGVRTPLERFMAGVDSHHLASVTGVPCNPEEIAEVKDFSVRVAMAARGRATLGSRVACLEFLAREGESDLLREGLQSLRQEGLESPGTLYLRVELSRLDGDYVDAFRLAIASESKALWGEFAAPRLRQLARVCREWGRPGLALPWLRDWLAEFPDSPDSGGVWADRFVSALCTSAWFAGEAREAYIHARAQLGPLPSLEALRPDCASEEEVSDAPVRTRT